jgi:hypothetical protein
MRHSTPTGGRYYRGVASEQDAEFFRSATVGTTYIDRAYGSFSSTFSIAKGFAEEHSATSEQVVIRTRAHFYSMPTEAIDAMHRQRGTFWESSSGENEFLAPRGASYRVTQVRQGISSGGRWRKYTLVDLEYLGVDTSRNLPPTY